MTGILGEPKDEPHKALFDHLSAFSGGVIDVQDWSESNGRAPLGWSLVTMPPSANIPFWTYATAGCWQAEKTCHWRSELVLATADNRPEHEQLLKMAAFFQLDPHLSIEPDKVLDIGHPWVEGSACTHLLASLPPPFAFGEYFEWPHVSPCTRYIWLMPITPAEADFANEQGVGQLEFLFEKAAIDFTDPHRLPVVG
ncbi:suppressor of fused domain protein [Sphingomonas sp.]|uniref:suppressor of fused domain protein n=1 Tax=Sphingomonas sp. TaxID=28214 RepID=UPI00286D6912|nr:suppressor of fused domain protein [Sphingomonas sp.]